MDTWNNIYSSFDPLAFSIFGFNVYWYSLCYIIALLLALILAKYFVKLYKIPIAEKMLDNYFIWAELGVILGARLGYIIIYDTNTAFYLSAPWQIFNPYANGEFVGIRGMSYHGAVLGFIIATFLFCRKHKQDLWLYLDLCALSIPLAYFFGRIGNFLNQELFGRETDLISTPWAIIVDGIPRHPSQLYEGVLEGFGVFFALLIAKRFQKANGELIALYAIFYTLARFICEFYRQPDAQLGFLIFGLSMGQLLSLLMFGAGILLLFYLKSSKNVKKCNNFVNNNKKSQNFK